MIGYRILGAVMIALSGIGVAYCLNCRASVALEQAEAWLAFLRYVKLRVECFSLPAPTILKQCDISLLRACGYTGELPPKSFLELSEGCHWENEETKQIAELFAKEFGRGYREEQLRSCEYYFSILNDHKNTLEKQGPIRKKLRTTLCISCAVAIVILLI
ncbi:MAG: hypothetical protein IJX94_03185 [Clostridia bacterium]|nr:hypothetical protein [Clostridia bacterium]